MQKKIIDTRGPWLESNSKKIHLVKAFNIVTNISLENNYALGLESKAKNLYFIVPREGKTVIGTFYFPFTDDSSEDLNSLKVKENEIKIVLEDLNKTIPNLNLKIENIEKFDIGLLPAKNIINAKPTLYNKEQVFVENGVVKVLSTKYTTFLSLGRKVLPYINS